MSWLVRRNQLPFDSLFRSDLVDVRDALPEVEVGRLLVLHTLTKKKMGSMINVRLVPTSGVRWFIDIIKALSIGKNFSPP